MIENKLDEMSLSRMIQAMPCAVAIATVAESRFVEVNDGFTDLLGYSREETVGGSVLGKDAWVNRDKLVRMVQEHGSVKNFEAELRTRSGEVRTVLSSVVGIQYRGEPCLMTVLQDITKQKRLKQELLLKDSAIDSSLNAMAIADMKGNILHANRACINLWGYESEHDIIGKSVLAFWKMTGKADTIFANIREGKSWRGELIGCKKDGTSLDAIVMVSLVTDTNGKRIGMVGSFVDITRDKQRATEFEFQAQLLKATTDVVFVRDAVEGNIVYVNDAATGLYGYSKEELASMPIDKIVTPGYPILDGLSPEELKQRGSINFEGCCIRKDGTIRQVEVRCRAITLNQKEYILSSVRDITERKMIEEALRESKEKYRMLTESSLTGIFIIQDGKFAYANNRAAMMHGYQLEEFLGIENLKLVHPDERRMTRKRIANHLEGKSIPGMIVERRLKKDGQTFSVELRGALINYKGKLALMGNMVDITDIKRISDELAASEVKYRTFVEASPDAIFSIDSEGHIVDCNEGFRAVSGYTGVEVIGKTVAELCPSRESRKFFLRMFVQGVNEGVPVEGEFELLTKEKESIDVWAKGALLPEQFQEMPVGLVYLRNITERRKIDQFKDEFIGLISHELRSPLTTIRGTLGTLATEEARLSPETQSQLLGDAVSEAESLSHTLDNLVELARAQAGQIYLQAQPVGIALALEEAVRKMRKLYPAHRFGIDTGKSRGVALADPLRLKHILYNLLENAAKYSRQGTEIRISVKAKGDSFIIGVSDQGISMSARDAARVFQPFERGHRLYHQRVKGVGLGLTVCARLVEAHGGRIWVESKRGQGSTFSLPCHGEVDEVQPPLSTSPEGIRRLGDTPIPSAPILSGHHFFK